MSILCPLCKQHPIASTPTTKPPGLEVNCEWCGIYWIEMSLIDPCKQKYAAKTWKVAAYVREKTSMGLDVALFARQDQIPTDAPNGAVGFEQAIESFPKSVAERFDRILLNLERATSHLGAPVKIEQGSQALMMAQNFEEISFVLSSMTELGYLAGYNSITPFNARITAKGLERVADLQRGHFAPLSKQAFVAMSFDKKMSEAWQQGLKLGIEDCGYTAIRMDAIEHNGDICEVMLAEIRKSKFIVADFTDHKHGVYFEAGFMMGLGRAVIFTCREDEFEKAHFDTNHYNHITWQTTGELREKLKRRIQDSIAP
jgi:nucleoside 2-deoxyribosyltransferase